MRVWYNNYMENNFLLERAKSLAVKIVTWCDDKKNKFLFKDEVVSSGLNVGALIYEAQFVVSKEEFLYKLEIALNECSQLEYWLELLKGCGKLDDELYNDIKNDAEAVRRALLRICIRSNKEK